MSTSFDRYNTHLNILHEALELIDVGKLAAECPFEWYNQTRARVNDAVVRLSVVNGEHHWHKHDNDDEFFYVVSGHFLIDLEDRTVTLNRRQGFVVPRGVRHRPRAPERTVILMVETVQSFRQATDLRPSWCCASSSGRDAFGTTTASKCEGVAFVPLPSILDWYEHPEPPPAPTFVGIAGRVASHSQLSTEAHKDLAHNGRN